jgi:hypothetical protein
VQKDTREDNVVAQGEQLFIKMQLKEQQTIDMQTMAKAQ